ncbi:hypothetical protein [Streptomyces sp. NPDC097610]|uniref:hypothetical protein n=1 Tax=Streptomyces sp. NPDC097610 TaxID=3157227 RepID=UPI003325F501
MPDEETAEAVVQLFGEPFDTGLATAERSLRTADFAAAQTCYEQLLAAAEDFEDSPDVRFLRAHLLADIGMVQLAATDLAGAATAIERALGLLRDIESTPMGPLGRQLFLDDLLKVLIGKADLSRRTGNLDRAQACLDEATARLSEFEGGDGTRAAELGNNRVQLLMSRSEWGAAEELASALLSTTPPTVPTVPHLLTDLALVCASTGRFDLAEDYLVRAEEGFRALGETGEQPQLIAHRAYVAMRRGDLDRAELLYAEASSVFERRRQFGDLAICEQARGFLAAGRGDTTGADDLMAAGLARFEQAGASIAAADTMLLAAQQAYGRGDIAEMQRLTEGAREVYEAQGVYERCAQADFMVASSIEDRLNRSDHGAHEQAAVDAALTLALPAALALEAARYDFATGHARSQWLRLAQEAMRLAFRLAVRRQDQGLLFELVEFRCAGAPLALDHRTPPPESAAGAAVFPDGAMKTYGHTSGDIGTWGGLRIGPPPQVLMSPDHDRTALREYVEAAESRYHRKVVSEETVQSW